MLVLNLSLSHLMIHTHRAAVSSSMPSPGSSNGLWLASCAEGICSLQANRVLTAQFLSQSHGSYKPWNIHSVQSLENSEVSSDFQLRRECFFSMCISDFYSFHSCLQCLQFMRMNKCPVIVYSCDLCPNLKPLRAYLRERGSQIWLSNHIRHYLSHQGCSSHLTVNKHINASGLPTCV